ncbi:MULTISPECIES: peptide chain release factor N(5)-glutamine methyltransferase [unclassified Streptomyces]|uniref:Release factor glutamine methyltransferase n=1 Tax=Streptomyces johnsoniae TaxID=3075532 RepID=A0ABU2S0R3_9ACTN|nr:MULTISPECIES: peptide chain release factor N(5)-glutamine methyltransferase [unclassified Streptomyces]MDT0441344.1 peptide chain release factor N(5)-glutamine methyltransferase [Streptomyces sp. DSM 41886]
MTASSVSSGASRSVLLAEVARATQRLADAGVPSPRFDAEELAAFVHGTERSRLHTVPDAEFDARYWEAVARREAREPLQHITGRAFFRYLELQVGPGVFVPRPETESVVGWAIDAVRAMDVAEPLIVDLCTGSGAIALALAQEVPRSRVHAVELDFTACEWARKNVEGSRVVLHQGDARAALPELGGQVDLVISNPPYIPLTEWEYVAPEARDHDPQLALFSGEDGLDVIRGLERAAHRLLRPGGMVVIEHADTQGGQVPWIFTEDRGWADAADHPDLNNRPRFATARRVAR